MFFFSLGIFLLSIWFLPWWSLALMAFLLGLSTQELRSHLALQVATAGAVAWCALAFVQDGRSTGMISQRLSGLFHLPSSLMIFAIVALLGAFTAGLPFQAGASLRSNFKR